MYFGVWRQLTMFCINLSGSSMQEVDVFPSFLGSPDLDDSDYVTQKMMPFIQHFYEFSIDELLALYADGITPEYRVATMVSDMRAVCAVDEVAKVIANVSASLVYRYLTTFSPVLTGAATPGTSKNYAYSGIDLDAFFDAMPTTVQSDVQLDFVRSVRAFALEFARDGVVGNWNRFPRTVYNVSTVVSPMTPRSASKECDFWRLHAFFPLYAWIN